MDFLNEKATIQRLMTAIDRDTMVAEDQNVLERSWHLHNDANSKPLSKSAQNLAVKCEKL